MATLYLRGVPERLVREAKAAAARRGVTLTVLVSEALVQILGVDVPGQTELPEDLQVEMVWYEAHRQDLLRRYRGEYLAIANQEVIDHDKQFGPLAKRVFKRLGVRPVFMPKCIGDERIVNIPSPRLVRT